MINLEIKREKLEVKSKEMDFTQFIDYLKGINENRIIAYSYYPLQTSKDKWEAMQVIRLELNYAYFIESPKKIAQNLLRLEVHFLKLTPSITSKLRETYLSKIKMAMTACRFYLHLDVQEY